jgi:uncharacterized protein YjiS (DUF1127 family)
MLATSAILNASLARPVARSSLVRPSLLRRLIARIARARAMQVRRRLLNELPDHLLKDIGINRCNIDYVAQLIVDERADPTRERSFANR